MAYVHLVVALAVLEYFAFGYAVGRARVTYNLPAPATTGNADFERRFRAQMNTLEQLVVFLPALLLFARYVSAPWAAGLGLVFLIGRLVYFVGYARSAGGRHTGFMIGIIPTAILLLGGLYGVVRAVLPG
ncbi:MAG: MAPEG family protein [Proteobacteria bacterium]|nr:MAPEG family protein [Pseudomonadota bacterium]